MGRDGFDEELFNELFKKHRGRVYAIARRYTASAEDALDIVQDVFIRVYTNFKDVDKVGSFESWVTRVTVNRCIDWLRKKRRETIFCELDSARFEDGSVDSPSERLGAEELKRAVVGALKRLSAAHRLVLTLWWKKSLSYREIAESMGCSVGTVMSRLHYARRYLKSHLEAAAVV